MTYCERKKLLEYPNMNLSLIAYLLWVDFMMCLSQTDQVTRDATNHCDLICRMWGICLGTVLPGLSA